MTLWVHACLHKDFQALANDLVPPFLLLRYLLSTRALQKATDFFFLILSYMFLTGMNQASACNQEIDF